MSLVDLKTEIIRSRMAEMAPHAQGSTNNLDLIDRRAAPAIDDSVWVRRSIRTAGPLLSVPSQQAYYILREFEEYYDNVDS